MGPKGSFEVEGKEAIAEKQKTVCDDYLCLLQFYFPLICFFPTKTKEEAVEMRRDPFNLSLFSYL